MTREKLKDKDIENNLILDLPNWYPEFLDRRPRVVEVLYNQFRWSKHLVFTFGDTDKQHLITILVKIITDREASGRTQNERLSPQRRVEYEFEALSSIYRFLTKTPLEGITAIRPLACYPDHNALVLEYAPGKNFLSLLQAVGRLGAERVLIQQVSQAAHAGGRLLGAVHKIPKAPYPVIQDFDFQEYYITIKEKLDNLSALGVNRHGLENLLFGDGILNTLATRRKLSTMKGYLHGDYYPENIVQQPDGCLYTIDTTLKFSGSIEQDVAKFIIGVGLSKRRLLYGNFGLNDIVLKNIEQSFLEGYRQQSQCDPVVLALAKILAALQRWIEVLEVAKRGPLAVPAYLFTSLRVNHVMSDYLKNILNEIRKNSES